MSRKFLLVPHDAYGELMRAANTTTEYSKNLAERALQNPKLNAGAKNALYNQRHAAYLKQKQRDEDKPVKVSLDNDQLGVIQGNSAALIDAMTDKIQETMGRPLLPDFDFGPNVQNPEEWTFPTSPANLRSFDSSRNPKHFGLSAGSNPYKAPRPSLVREERYSNMFSDVPSFSGEYVQRPSNALQSGPLSVEITPVPETREEALALIKDLVSNNKVIFKLHASGKILNDYGEPIQHSSYRNLLKKLEKGNPHEDKYGHGEKLLMSRLRHNTTTGPLLRKVMEAESATRPKRKAPIQKGKGLNIIKDWRKLSK